MISMGSPRRPMSGSSAADSGGRKVVCLMIINTVCPYSSSNRKAQYHISMCGRLDQNDISRLLVSFDWVDEVLNRSEARDRWNVPPGTYRPVLHMEDGRLVADDVFWSY